MQYESICPWTEETLERCACIEDSVLARTLDELESSFPIWKAFGVNRRLELLRRLVDGLEKSKYELAETISLEMGKLKKEAISEIEKCKSLCLHYLAQAESNLTQKKLQTSDGSAAALDFEPLGCILGVMPWNFPFWQVFRFAVPALLVGNTVILKPAPNVAGCAKAIEKLFSEASELKVFANLLLSNDQVAALLEDSRIVGLSFTGSSRLGQSLLR